MIINVAHREMSRHISQWKYALPEKNYCQNKKFLKRKLNLIKSQNLLLY
jgi:hypothetical protein